MKYSDIPQFPRSAYQCHIPWPSVEEKIQAWQSEGPSPLNIDPDYQREHVWTSQQQVNYLEYCLQGGEVGKTIIFNCPGWMRDWGGPFELIDGKQRIEAVRAFFRDEVPVFGYAKSQIEGPFPWSDLMFLFQVCTIPDRAGILHLYLNINAGGTPHTEAELNRVRQLLNDISKNGE